MRICSITIACSFSGNKRDNAARATHSVAFGAKATQSVATRETMLQRLHNPLRVVAVDLPMLSQQRVNLPCAGAVGFWLAAGIAPVNTAVRHALTQHEPLYATGGELE